MCTFCKTSELPTHNKSELKNKNSFISYFLKPNSDTNPNEKYRLRLLFFRNERLNDRKDAYILQRIHDHWGTSPKGTKIVDDFVVCPGTGYTHYDDEKFVFNERTGKKELNCPLCRKFSENIGIYMNSGKTDKLSLKKAYQFKSKERLCVPVYVVNDPINEKNNGHLKVLILTNPDDIKIFQKTIDDERTKAYLASKEGRGYEVFNGQNAVDLYIRVETVSEVRNQGKSNEFVSNVRKITQIAFGKTAHTIEAINKDAIDGFGFDEQFYISNTKDELQAFYDKYYGQNDITPEEEDVFSNSTPSEVRAEINNSEPYRVHTENTSVQQKPSEGIDDIVSDMPFDDVTSPEINSDVIDSSQEDKANADELRRLIDEIE